MSTALKPFVAGLLIGAAVAAPIAYNGGRGAPLLSNPFAERSLATTVKEKAESLRDDVREKLHEATKLEKPAR